MPETWLAALYWKAMESQRPDAMIKDEKAVALVTQMGLDFAQVRQIKMNELLKAMRIIFTREGDPSTSFRAGGIRLLDERFPFQFPEVDQRRALRVRLFSPLVMRGIGVFRYQL